MFVCVLPRKDVWRKHEATIKFLLTQEIQISRKKKRIRLNYLTHSVLVLYVAFQIVILDFVFLYEPVVEQFFPSGSGICDARIFTAGKLQHHQARQNHGKVSGVDDKRTEKWNLFVKQMTKIYLEQMIISLSTNNILIWREVALRYSHLSSLLAARGEGSLRFGPKTSILMT